MEHLAGIHAKLVKALPKALSSCRATGRRLLSPMGAGGWRRLVSSREVSLVFLVLGLMVQLVLLFLVGEMIDLAVSLAELWAELATKHLEIVLSE